MKTTLKHLIDAKAIRCGRKVMTMKYRGVTVDIDLLDNGTLSWNGDIFSTPSNFSVKFKRLITPQIQSDNGFNSILYNGKPLTMYVAIYKTEIELEIMKSHYKLFCETCDTEIESVEYPAEIVTKYYDGGSNRPLCRDPHNINKSRYGIICSEHVSDCDCPTHRSKTLWRRLTGAALQERKKKIKGDPVYLKTVIGLPIQEYYSFLENRFRQTFHGILPPEVLEKQYHQLCDDGFVLDEWYPRCEGKHLKFPIEIAVFLAKVFNYQNTQLLLRDNPYARNYGIDTHLYKELINGSKGGIVCPNAKTNFDMIEPSEEAISYMLTFVNNFMKMET